MMTKQVHDWHKMNAVGISTRSGIHDLWQCSRCKKKYKRTTLDFPQYLWEEECSGSAEAIKKAKRKARREARKMKKCSAGTSEIGDSYKS